MCTRIEPDPSLSFRVTRLPSGVTAPDIVKAVVDILPNILCLNSVQHVHRGLYKVTVTTQEAAKLLKDRGKLQIKGTEIPIAPFGRPVMIAVIWYPLYFSDRELLETLKQYGTINKVVPTYYKDHPTILTGTKKIWMDMHTPVPNLMWIMGVRVVFEYNGVERMCFRCKETGHTVRNCPIKSLKKCYDCRNFERQTTDVPCPKHMAPVGIELSYPVPSTDDAATSTAENKASEVDQESNSAGAEGSGTESVAEVKQQGNGKRHSKKHKKKKHKKRGRR